MDRRAGLGGRVQRCRLLSACRAGARRQEAFGPSEYAKLLAASVKLRATASLTRAGLPKPVLECFDVVVIVDAIRSPTPIGSVDQPGKHFVSWDMLER